MDTLREALYVEVAALREKLADIDMLMDSISDISVARAPGEAEVSDKVRAYLIKHTSTDKDVVCSQVDRDEFEAFVNKHGGSKVGKTVKLIDYLAIKSAVKAAQATSVTRETTLIRPRIGEMRSTGVGVGGRDILGEKDSPNKAWDVFFETLQRVVVIDYKKEIDVLMESSGRVELVVNNLIEFMADADRYHEDTGNQAISELWAGWIKEWMGSILEK
ncbi:hypothetical protein VE02_04841 [Pseudogymnoascus sp. 03VT05]|nr:hypothetical protein VE02_04841 [Pseudogymnoascus sp. 03VT05]